MKSIGKNIGIFSLHLIAVYISSFQFTAWASWFLSGFIFHTAHTSEFLFVHLVANALIVGVFAGTFNIFMKHRLAVFVCIAPIALMIYKLYIFQAGVFESQLTSAIHYYFSTVGINFSGIPSVDGRIDFRSIDMASVRRCSDQLYFIAPVFASIGYSFSSWLTLKVPWRLETKPIDTTQH